MPSVAFINKMDVDGADFFGTIERMRELFGKGIMPLQIPIGEGANFEGVVDVAKMTAFTYKDGQPTEIAVPAHLIEKAQCHISYWLRSSIGSYDPLHARCN